MEAEYAQELIRLLSEIRTCLCIMTAAIAVIGIYASSRLFCLVFLQLFQVLHVAFSREVSVSALT